jgi:hypothetical protein
MKHLQIIVNWPFKPIIGLHKVGKDEKFANHCKLAISSMKNSFLKFKEVPKNGVTCANEGRACYCYGK